MKTWYSPNCRSIVWQGICIAIAVFCILPSLGLFLQAISAPSEPTGNLGFFLTYSLTEYSYNTLLLMLITMLGTVCIGSITAWLTTSYRFPGRKVLEYLLVLPLAVPAYVLAYAMTDLLQFSGPVQGAIRELTGQSRLPWFPEIRSIGGAALVFTFAFYPYVYLLAKASMQERSPHLMYAARSLGSSRQDVFWRVLLPIARPGIVAGAILVMMETLSDFGSVLYFGVDTLGIGIFKLLQNYSDPHAAAVLALILSAMVALCVWGERRNRTNMQFYQKNQRPITSEDLPSLQGIRGWGVCLMVSLPFIIGFLVPVFAMLRLILKDLESIAWTRYLQAITNTVGIATLTAILIICLSIFLAYSARLYPTRMIRTLNRTVLLGYSIPGVVLAISITQTLAVSLTIWPELWQKALMSTSIFALLYAYIVRFLGVGLQTIEAGLLKITPSIDATARSLGRSPLQVLRQLHVPLLKRSVLTVLLLVMVDVMKELPATYLLRPANFETLATMTNQFARDERLGEAALPALTIVVLATIPMLFLNLIPSTQKREKT